MPERPLRGRRVAVTRAEDGAGALADLLAAEGAVPLVCPTIAFAPPDDDRPLAAALDQLESYDWLIVTSPQAARVLLDRLAARGIDRKRLRHLKLGAVGRATAAPLREAGLAVDFVPQETCAEGIVREIGDVTGQRVLFPRADLAREALACGLSARGAVVDDPVAYRTVPGPGVADLIAHLRARRPDAITFASPSSARYLIDRLDGPDEARRLLGGIAIACIGPTTADALRGLGLSAVSVAAEQSSAGLVEALAEWFARDGRDG